MMIKQFLVYLCIFAICQTANACNEDSAIEQLIKIEEKKILSNAPTLKHAWQDKLFTFNFKDFTHEGVQCKATLKVSIPQKDLDETNQHLDQNPAKRILVAAQGYGVPENTVIEVPFYYQIVDGKTIPNDPNSAELKSLHNNLEYTYQLLAQLRINVEENLSNSSPWSEPELIAEIKYCQDNTLYKNKAANFCNCRASKLSKVISPRKMELIHYIQTQPYSVATGSTMSFEKLSEKIDASCSSN